MATIHGIVSNLQNQALENVNIAIVSGPSHPEIAPVSDATGSFSFPALTPGEYIIRAFGDFASEEIPVTVSAGRDSVVHIRINEASTLNRSNVVDEIL